MKNRKTFERISFTAIIVLLASMPLYVFVNVFIGGDQELPAEPQFVGRETCIECHLNEHNDWVGSDHDRAMDHANDSTVLGDFNDQSIVYNGMTHKMYKRDGRFYVLTDGEHGSLEEFEVKYVFGYDPLQQYLVEFDRGRLQVLPITWDTQNSQWYHMAGAIYRDEVIDHGNWLHWTNQAQNWNSMCADCHSTNLEKGYDVESDSYQTTWSEIDVSCEACHGPASEHLSWAAKAEYARDTDTNYGLVVQTSNIDNKAYVDLCVRCHSRRSTLEDFNHSEDIYNHSIPVLPTGEPYHIDGQILDEDYVYGSFTQSKMYMRDVSCNDCHNVHSTKLLFEDNRLCTQCHRADDYDTYSHHFHKYQGEKGEAVVADDGVRFEVGEGTRCVNCHMPAQFYMSVDYRSDHSIRIPRPDLTKELGTPNACNQCHDEKSVDWAIEYVNEWYGIGRPYQYGIAFQEALTGSDKGYEALVHIYRDNVYPEIIRATALQLLGLYYPARGQEILIEALGNANNHIRYHALNSLSVTDEKTLNVVLNLLNDQTKAIRVESAALLSTVDQGQIPAKYRPAYNNARAEYLSYLEYNADFPTGKFNLANFYYNNNEINKAEEFFVKTLEQDSLLHPVKVNLALLYHNKKEYDKAERLFKNYLGYNPEDGNTLFTYALFLSEQQRYDESLTYLVQAAEHSPNNARVMYNTAMMYDFMKDYNKAESYLNKAIEISPMDSNYYLALLNLHVKYQQNQKAKELAKTILDQFPDIQNRDQIEAIIQN
tara:strand:- start:314 stop:2611 length:2298 start_codon:yes stop_codon:yes gene_type:complete